MLIYMNMPVDTFFRYASFSVQLSFGIVLRTFDTTFIFALFKILVKNARNLVLSVSGRASSPRFKASQLIS